MRKVEPNLVSILYRLQDGMVAVCRCDISEIRNDDAKFLILAGSSAAVFS